MKNCIGKQLIRRQSQYVFIHILKVKTCQETRCDVKLIYFALLSFFFHIYSFEITFLWICYSNISINSYRNSYKKTSREQNNDLFISVLSIQFNGCLAISKFTVSTFIPLYLLHVLVAEVKLSYQWEFKSDFNDKIDLISTVSRAMITFFPLQTDCNL